MMRRILVAALLALAPVLLAAQRGMPSGPPLPTPRFPDGTPNLGRVAGEKGIWNVPWIRNMALRVQGATMPAQGRGGNDLQGRGARNTAGLLGHDPTQDGSKLEPWMPFMPWTAAVYDYNVKNESKYDPEGYCLPPGGPRMMATPYPMEMIQLPDQKRVIQTFEGATHVWREIYLDGREHPKGDALNPTYLGHSVGRWEGDILVVDVVGFNEGTWVDYSGHPHTDMMHVIEKYSRPNKGTMHYEVTIDDPGAYTKPWTASWNIPWNANGELTEYICQENNRYLLRLTDDFGKPIFDPKR